MASLGIVVVEAVISGLPATQGSADSEQVRKFSGEAREGHPRVDERVHGLQPQDRQQQDGEGDRDEIVGKHQDQQPLPDVALGLGGHGRA